MISKVVAADSFYHTCRYITNKPGAEVLDVQGVRGHSFKLMAEDFLTQQEMRPNKERACFHGILSFYPGEKPSDKMMREIARTYLEQLGIINTQYAISKHTDKAHIHMHIVANMVNNDGKSIRDSYIGLRGKKIAQRLTQEYKLIPALEKNLKLTHLENLSETEANRYKVYIAIAEGLPFCKNLADMEARLLKQGIETQYKYKGQTNVKQGISFRIGKFCFKGSQVDRKFSFSGLEKVFGQNEKLHQIRKLGQEYNVDVFTETESKQNSNKVIQPWNSVPKFLVSGISIGEGAGSELARELEKSVGELLKPVENNEEVPYELMHEERLRHRKKRSQKHKR